MLTSKQRAYLIKYLCSWCVTILSVLCAGFPVGINITLSTLKRCDFVAVTRSGYGKNKLFDEITEIRDKFASRIHYMEDITLSTLKRCRTASAVAKCP